MKGQKGLFVAEELIRALGGDCLGGDPSRVITGVSTDSRTLRPGELFVALKGERYDGHHFFAQALARGAGGLLGRRGTLQRRPDGWGGTVPLIEVDDTLYSLGEIARFWRQRHPVPLLAITGSNGKTTTKEMVAGVLSRTLSLLKTEGNLNNLIGLPLTILGLRAQHQAAVVEMGMSEAGEIRRLCEIARPQFGLITQVAPAHLEKLGGIEGVASAKGELFQALREGDAAIVNLDDPWILRLARSARTRWITYGESGEAAVRATELEPYRPAGARWVLEIGGESRPVEMRAHGRPYIQNALAAAAAGWAMGAPVDEIARGLGAFHPLPGRGRVLSLGEDVHLIDDTYNANPFSMESALEALSQMATGRTMAVLGDMRELGALTPLAHRTVGKRAADLGVEILIAVGESAADLAGGAWASSTPPDEVVAVSSTAEALEAVLAHYRQGDWILLKASRAVGLERVMEGLRTRLGPGVAPAPQDNRVIVQ